MYFSKIFQIIFIIGSTFLISIPECLNNSWWCFSSSFSTFEDRRRVLPPYLIRSVKIRGSSLITILLQLFSIVRILFTYPEQFKILFNLILRSPSFQKTYSFSSFSFLSLNLTSTSFKYSLISSGSLHSLVSKFS